MQQPEVIVEKTFVSNYLSKPQWIVLNLVLCILLSLLHWKNIFGLSSYLTANRELIFEHYELWRLLTSMYVHGDFQHLLSNSFFFSIFSFYVASYFGRKHYLFLVLFFGALIHGLSLFFMKNSLFLVGISGLVYFLGGFWLSVYLFIERNKAFAIRALRSLGVAFLLLAPGPFAPKTSYLAHFVGFALSVCYAPCYFYWNKQKIRSFEKYKLDIFEDIGFKPSEFQ